MDALDISEARSFISRMLDLTQRKRIEWEPATKDNVHAFLTSVPGYSFIVESRDGDDVHPFDLLIYRYADDTDEPSVTLLDSIGTEELTQDVEDMNNLAALYHGARRQ